MSVVAVEAALERALGGDARAVGRLLTAIADDPAGASTVAAGLAPRPGAVGLGITGPPGVGKSCLVAALVDEARRAGRAVAVLCVDPSSPLTGGAVLGDRIRMQRHNSDAGVFIRSFASRGSLGGLAAAVRPAVPLLEACGFDAIIVETVGVGQNEIAVASALPTCVLVLSPATGDAIQAIKGGVLEVADIVAVNKADLGGAERVVADLRQALAGTSIPVPVLKASAETRDGIADLWTTVLRRERAREPHATRDEVTSEELLAAVESLLRTALGTPHGRDVARAFASGSLSALDAATGLLQPTTPRPPLTVP